ncbi:MAG: Nudix family hydrolase [Dokdonella sp.]
MLATSRIHVVAGVIRDDRGRVLLAQRPAGKEHAGLWEFPGGKVESTEQAEAALVRELNEELGIRARIGRRVIAVPNGRMVLDVYRVLDFQGVVHAREAQNLAWIAPEDIEATRLPPADRPVLAALRLPDHYLITPTLVSEEDSAFLSAIDHALAAGIRMIQLRQPGRPRGQLAPLARQVRERCRRAEAILLLNTDWQLAELLGLDGVHLPAHVARTLSRRPLPKHRWLGVSCHDANELQHAAAIGADFATLSPIHFTPGHAHSQPLGWQRAEALIAESSIPVYALGGMQHSEVNTAHVNGAQGIAAIRSLWPD